MQEDVYSKISELVDDELTVGDALSLLDTVKDCPELEKKVYRYLALSQLLKPDKFFTADVEFVNRVKQEVQQEPTYLIPYKQPNTRNYQIISAMAASLAIMGIVIYGGMSKSIEEEPPALQIAADTGQQYADHLSVSSLYKTDPRLNNYLEAHQGSLYMAGSPAYQSYVRLADHGQE